MKLLVLTLLVAAVVARPDVSHLTVSSSDRDAQILKQDLDVGPDGSYHYAFESSNGIKAHEHGELKDANTDHASEIVQGAFGWQSPEGENVDITYTADENGYQAQGSVIPTPPPIPEAILRSLEYIKAHPPPPEQK